ncbi:MAG: MFS transporter [Chloroflexales bacterium]|nr:MFS transporter [Chloroflexales bacterium]
MAQILIWGGSFFLLAVLAPAVIRETGWASQGVYGSLSVSIFISGVLAPVVGRWIERYGGNQLLLNSGFIVGLGLVILSFAPTLAVFLLGWCIIGIGMALGLYDALFATLGQHYGPAAKGAIVQVTLIAGFCTTVTWPLLSALLHAHGWRGTCLIYGLVLWGTIWPLNKLGLPAASTAAPPSGPARRIRSSAEGPLSPTLYGLLAIQFTLGAIIMTAMSVQLIALLQAGGIAQAAAVGLAALIGPCQVGIRLLDVVTPKKHPIWSAILSALLTVGGFGLLLLGPAFALVGVVLYALGNGMRAIIRGTLPLVLFGPARYPVVLGRLALPTLLAQAVTPLVGSALLQAYGAAAVLMALFGLSVINMGVTLAIRWRIGG